MSTQPSIILVGPMGAGKSAVGRKLAARLHMPFHDSDDEIEHRTGVDIPYIFDKEGESGFRKREERVIAELTSLNGIVLATGGGAVQGAANRRCIAARGTVVYLYATVDQQLQRTRHGRERPKLLEGEPREVLDQLMKIRDPLYRELADIIVETDGRNVSSVVQEIADKLQQLSAGD